MQNYTIKRKITFPNIMEAVFEIFYLLFVFISAFIFFFNSNGKTLFIFYGLAALILGTGDAFHLIPRILKSFCGISDHIKKWLGIGLFMSSVTMTVFYIFLMYIWQLTFNLVIPVPVFILVWACSILRILICFLPQNGWCKDIRNIQFSIVRNSLLLISGLCIIFLYVLSDNLYGYGLFKMAIAIFISFLCYIPVTLFSKKNPKIGMLMIPKSCAYIWMIILGLKLLSVANCCG